MNLFGHLQEYIFDCFRGSRLKQAIIGYVTLAGLYTVDGSVQVEEVQEALGISDAQWRYEFKRLSADADLWTCGEGRVISGLVYELARYAPGGFSGRPAPKMWQALRRHAHEAAFEYITPRCVACRSEGVPLALDHVVPVARGGSNHPLNFVWLCVPCNSSKGTKTWEEWNPTRRPR